MAQEVPGAEVRPRGQRLDAQQQGLRGDAGPIRAGEIQVMLGTQMIAKGLDYPNVTLVGVISGDTALALPDFRAAERTFQLITQVAGRAGRGDNPGPRRAADVSARRPDDPGGASGRTSSASRRPSWPPPRGRPAAVRADGADRAARPGADKLHKRGEQLAAHIDRGHRDRDGGGAMQDEGPDALRHQPDRRLFPQPDRDAGRRRPRRCSGCWRRCAKGGLAKSDRVAVDVDPVSLL